MTQTNAEMMTVNWQAIYCKRIDIGADGYGKPLDIHVNTNDVYAMQVIRFKDSAAQYEKVVFFAHPPMGEAGDYHKLHLVTTHPSIPYAKDANVFVWPDSVDITRASQLVTANGHVHGLDEQLFLGCTQLPSNSTQCTYLPADKDASYVCDKTEGAQECWYKTEQDGPCDIHICRFLVENGSDIFAF
jgi:hypothetical protein